MTLLETRIGTLRPRLLDLTRKNPLLATPLSARSSSVFRAIDEPPESIFGKLMAGTKLRFVPLPDLDDEPADEKTKSFKSALSSARLTDEQFLAETGALDEVSENFEEENRRLERALRDRLRTALGMRQRQTGTEVSLSQHALNNRIAPSYELPSELNREAHRSDADIQTLFLPEEMDRKLHALSSKCKSWAQETGINVLHAAFGFLEWSEPNVRQSAFAPLVLLPIEIEKRKTGDGAEYWIGSTSDEPETNLVLAEKLRLQFNVALPTFDGGSLEHFFSQIAAATPSTVKWKVRRQVGFGVFPSARMAMYNDTAPGRHDLNNSQVVNSLFGGASSVGATPFADEYEVDRPEIESKVPYLVMDADSSQFSAIVDVAQGKNLALEGPPGTGKSQTIVNTIATALAEGKKVLFVAEKTAALEVVKSRLESIGLGEFVLPLQAERSNRKLVAQSLKARLDMETVRVAADFQARIDRFRKIRAELGEYIQVVREYFGATGLTVFEVIGNSLASNAALSGLPKDLQLANIAGCELIDRSRIEELTEIAAAIERAWAETTQVGDSWKGLTLDGVHKFDLDRLSDATQQAASAIEQVRQARETLSEFEIDSATKLEALDRLNETLTGLVQQTSELDRTLVAQICSASDFEALDDFVTSCAAVTSAAQQATAALKNPTQAEWPQKLRAIDRICRDNKIKSLDLRPWRQQRDDEKRQLATEQETHRSLETLLKEVPDFASASVSKLRRMGQLVHSVGPLVLSLRSSDHLPAGSVQIIRLAIEQGRALQERRTELSKSFSILPEDDAPKLIECALTIRAAGFFDRFGPKYQAAKRFYISHANGRFERQLASDSLRKLADWKQDAQRYAADERVRLAIGKEFKAHDTDFDAFEKLANYYSSAEALAEGDRDCVSFLKSAPLETILLLPPHLPDVEATSPARLAEAILARQASAEKADVDDRELTSLISHFATEAPPSLRTIRALATTLERAAELSTAMDTNEPARRVLAQKFAGAKTNLAAVIREFEIARGLQDNQQLKLQFGGWVERNQEKEVLEGIQKTLSAISRARRTVADLISISGVDFRAKLSDRPSGEQIAILQRASEDRAGMRAHANLQVNVSNLERHGFGWIVATLEESSIPLQNLSKILQAVIYRAMAMRAFAKHGKVLARYSGRDLDERRAALAKLDKEIIELSQAQLRKLLRDRARPPTGNGSGRRSTWTQLSLVENEANKVQGHIPLRELNARASRALMELKPCWMMSPLAVAQYLPAGRTVFDLCIIDEASQMPPEDALGALARCKQAMIVGDTNQLPPSTFFKKMIDDDEAEQDEAVVQESILELANGAFRPARRLRWHYRSRHSGLIRFSNEHIYGGNLIVFPSSHELRVGMGVSLVKVEGRYKSGTNPPEAQAIAEAAIQHMRKRPDKSLGIVTMNQKQRELIQLEIDRALSQDPRAGEFVDAWISRKDGLEEFFVKNLENVQGDERDVIFIGTLYGSEAPGERPRQNFGPVNGVAGRRRLNVLFTRAKDQIVTFSSMSASDIVADENGNPGNFLLKQWLEYSASGVLYQTEANERGPGSPFEEYVIEQLQSMGCQTVPQVGAAGYFIDIGVKHPRWPHGFILAVECDGATYHSAKSARDRDRIRQEVLEKLGWRFHRIWSTDWFNDPASEGVRLRGAIEARLRQLEAQGSEN